MPPWISKKKACQDNADKHRVVVHLSVIHATLPRINRFLTNLQTGLVGTRINGNEYELSQSKGDSSSGNKALRFSSFQQKKDEKPLHLAPSDGLISTTIYADRADDMDNDSRNRTVGSRQDHDEAKHGVWRHYDVTVKVEGVNKETVSQVPSGGTGSASA